MIYDIIISEKAEKDFIKIQKIDVIKIVDKIESLAENPYPTGCKKIKASDENLYRIRQGDYRIIYCIKEKIQIVEVRRIGHRRNIYKKLLLALLALLAILALLACCVNVLTR